MRRSAAMVLAVTAVVGPVAYILLTVVLGALQSGYDPIRDTQSELGAVDAPYRWIMNVGGFMGLGLSILAFAIAYRMVLPGGWVHWVAVGLLTAAGLGMVIVGFFPCDADCVDVTSTGRLHGVFSMPGAIGLPAGAMVSSWVFAHDDRFGRGWSEVSLLIGALTLASGPLIQAGIVDDANGLLQRLGMWPALLWMSVVAWRLFRLAAAPASVPSAA